MFRFVQKAIQIFFHSDISIQGFICAPRIGDENVLFGRTTESTGKSELIVLITPRVIGDDDTDNLEAIEKSMEAEERMKQQ